MTGHILVTGGAGFIGTRLARHLVRRGEQVVVLDCLSAQVHAGRPWVPPDGVEFIHGDVRDAGAVRNALAGADRIVHLAAETGVGQSAYEIARYVDVNERGTAVLLEEAARTATSLRAVVLASSRAVYGEGRYRCRHHGNVFPSGRSAGNLALGCWEPRCPSCGLRLTPLGSLESQPASPASVYGVTKLNQEHLLACFARAYGVTSVALRLQNVYGPGQALGNPYTGIISIFATRLAAGSPIELYEDGRPTRDFVFVDDVVRAFSLALGTGREGSPAIKVLNVGSGRAATVREVAKMLAAAIGGAGDLVVTGKYRVGDIRHALADLTAVRRELGFEPRVGLQKGLRAFATWTRESAPARDGFAEMEKEMAARGILVTADAS